MRAIGSVLMGRKLTVVVDNVIAVFLRKAPSR
jgi:hypothetical protein